MPVVNIFLGGADFSELKVELPRIVPVYKDVLNEAGEVIGQEYVPHYLTYGNFISAVINFAIIAIVVFLIVKGLNALSEIGKKKEEEVVEAPAEPPAPPAPSTEEVLLTEIRDLLKNK
jgi:large conductance mechanosensitive channel